MNYDKNLANKTNKATIAGQAIDATQLGRSDSEWRNGYGMPSDGKDTNSKNQPTRKLTKDAKSLIIYFQDQVVLNFWQVRLLKRLKQTS
ncbi:hypothetical protein [Companilactobacillus alimentarius]|uniref:hypothetical protein n=1 Tax=Companilactobacillus alimentarius TaxID=1602 RepID=UPI0028B2D937|nr:hypothetical protein [Companilactobacillus alimentarius]MDT6952745.1 hypothetical protein [Companilactobacillus alimentarius]